MTFTVLYLFGLSADTREIEAHTPEEAIAKTRAYARRACKPVPNNIETYRIVLPREFRHVASSETHFTPKGKK